MICTWILITLSAFLVPVNAATISASYSTGFSSCDNEKDHVGIGQSLELICRYDPEGETVSRMQWEDTNENVVFNSNGVNAGALLSNLAGRGSYEFSQDGDVITNTVTISSFDETLDTERYNCIVSVAVDENQEVELLEPFIGGGGVSEAQLSDISFDGHDSGSTTQESGSFELGITVVNPVVGGETYLCPKVTISIVGGSTLPCQGSSDSNPYRCSVTLEEDEYQNEVDLEAFASMLGVHGGSIYLRAEHAIRRTNNDDDNGDASFPAWPVALCNLVIGGIVAAVFFHKNGKKKRKTEKDKVKYYNVKAEVTNARGQNLDPATGKHHCEEIVAQLEEPDSRVTTELKHEYSLNKREVALEGDQKFKLSLSPESDTLWSDVDSNEFGQKIKKKCNVGHKKTYEKTCN